MPGLDGTGPMGMGPMTGRGRGMCVLKMPSGPGQSVTGIAGGAGSPVGPYSSPRTELALLRRHAERIETVLRSIHERIEQLEASRIRAPAGE